MIVKKVVLGLCWVTADMWFGMTVETEKVNIFIQCDDLDLGLMAAIKILQKFENKPLTEEG